MKQVPCPFFPPTDTAGGKKRYMAGVKYLLMAAGSQAVIVNKWLLELLLNQDVVQGMGMLGSMKTRFLSLRNLEWRDGSPVCKAVKSLKGSVGWWEQRGRD